MQTTYEQLYIKKGHKHIVGLDEAGRGSWAGPIVAGCVTIVELPALIKQNVLASLQDSKKLSARKREQAYKLITAHCLWSVGLVDSKEIDAIGIGQANKLAMRRAVKNISPQPDMALIDYFGDVGLKIKSIGVPQGDGIVASIAAASIVAKVYRDELMKQLDTVYPVYGFAQHKGYGTRQHKELLQQHGPCSIHRMSYRPVDQCRKLFEL